MEIILNPLFKLSAISFILFISSFLPTKCSSLIMLLTLKVSEMKWFPFFPFVMKNESVNKE